MTKSAHSVGIHEAKTHFSRLVERVAAGEEIEITRRGEVVARLVAPPSTRVRRLGVDIGQVRIAADFDAPLPVNLRTAFER